MNLDSRKNLSGLQSQMPALSPEQLKDSVDRLTVLGLLFEENGSYMNLIFHQEPTRKGEIISHISRTDAQLCQLSLFSMQFFESRHF